MLLLKLLIEGIQGLRDPALQLPEVLLEDVHRRRALVGLALDLDHVFEGVRHFVTREFDAFVLQEFPRKVSHRRASQNREALHS